MWTRGTAAAPSWFSSRGSEVNPPDIVRGRRPLAAPAVDGGGRSLLALGQAGPAQEVPAGELVHRLRLEVAGEGFAAGSASLGLAAPAVLCKYTTTEISRLEKPPEITKARL